MILNVQEQLTGDDITANYELLPATGLMLHDPFMIHERCQEQ